ncbi:Fatty acid-binding protein homolog 6 [Caenorhabditis elegans]|uniref:Fatty acid-binding protein homolog 6 n=1 Tax=Caenorhabditis elegans TaxID=6239 RepID=FABP6_CAEEL|nr:Fatty acid-binding protein homolog 6 [Caenorhabditis elegans]O01812.1 RecName: Full=Fatty acid-binding protein homolog 6 [Caenorhabditis elegans]CCD68988.1 Fatty acid-binding protein homolog 6 [Caenorhabditis elegans]|eukprot:NP_491926.1 Fatty acid-binding protein homolog 6 [Caenorhabditis elegans]
MSQEFVGRWKLIHSENFEEYMKEVGVGLITRKAAANLKPTLEIKVEGDLWYSNQYSTFKNTTLSFKLGQEFDETTPDGRTVKSVVNFENGKFIHIQKKIKDSDKESIITRWLEGDKLITTLESGSVVSRREYVRE